MSISFLLYFSMLLTRKKRQFPSAGLSWSTTSYNFSARSFSLFSTHSTRSCWNDRSENNLFWLLMLKKTYLHVVEFFIHFWFQVNNLLVYFIDLTVQPIFPNRGGWDRRSAFFCYIDISKKSKFRFYRYITDISISVEFVGDAAWAVWHLLLRLAVLSTDSN